MPRRGKLLVYNLLFNQFQGELNLLKSQKFFKDQQAPLQDILKKMGMASVNVDGRMIDIASAERCRRILTRADAIAEMDRRKNEALKDPDSL